MRRSSSGGTVDAPTKPIRSDDRSASPSRASRSDENSVGGPGSADTLSVRHQREQTVDVEGGHRQRRRALLEARHPPRLVAEAVEEGVDDQVPVAVTQPEAVGPPVEGEQGRAVLEHHALRTSGGARGEDHVGDVVRSEGRDARVGVGLVDRGARGEVVVEGVLVGACARQQDDVVQAAQMRRGVAQHGDVVRVEEPANGEERGGVDPVEHVRSFVALEPGVHRYEPGARAECAERGHDPFPRIGRPDRDPVTRPDPLCHRGSGRPARQGRELAEREARPAVDHRFGVAVAGGRPLGQRGDRSDRFVRVHDPAASARRRG